MAGIRHLSVCLLIAFEVLAQSPVRPKLLTGPELQVAEYSQSHFTPGRTALAVQFLGDLVYFASGELWRTDGTDPGTRVFGGSLPSGTVVSAMQVVGTRLVFATGVDSSSGRLGQLWVTDGTATGTQPVTGIETDGVFEVMGSLAYFVGGSAKAPALWSSDGTVAGTRKICTLPSDFLTPPARTSLKRVEGLLYCASAAYPDRVLVADGVSSSATTVSVPAVPFAIHAVSGRPCLSNQLGLWIQDARGDFTTPLLSGGVDSALAVAGKLYFAVFGQLWVTDGTPDGTRRITGRAIDGADTFRVLSSMGAKCLVLAGFNGVDRLVVTDGTDEGSQVSEPIVPGGSPGATGITNAVSGPSRTFLLWQDRVVAVEHGSLLLNVSVGPPASQLLGTLGNELCFVGSTPDSGSELWRTDGTPFGARQVAELGIDHAYVISHSVGFTSLGDRWLFTAETAHAPASVFVMEESTDEVRRLPLETVSPIAFDEMALLGVWQGRAAFVAHSRERQWLGLTDGTLAGTKSLMSESCQAGWSTPFSMVPLDDRALFCLAPKVSNGSDNVVWTSDGTPEGTKSLHHSLCTHGVETRPIHRRGSQAYFLTDVVAGLQWFNSTADSSFQLWRSDGTPAGTSAFVGIGYAAGGCELAIVGREYFWTDGGVFHSDGSPDSGHLIEHPAGWSGMSLVEFAGRAWWLHSRFGWRGGVARSEYDLAASNGTVAGTQWVTNDGEVSRFGLLPIPSSKALLPLADRLLFVRGPELWSADAAGAVTRIWRSPGNGSGSASSRPRHIIGLGSSRYAAFIGSDAFGIPDQVWVTDGTVAGTRRALDLSNVDGRRPAGVTWLWVAGRKLFVGLQTTAGQRIGHVDLSALGVPVTEVAGVSCGLAGTVPQIGTSGDPSPSLGRYFRIEVRDAARAAPCVLAIGDRLVPGAWHSRCQVRLAPPFESYPRVTDRDGSASVPLWIPNQAALQGLELFAEWYVLEAGAPVAATLAQSSLLRVILGR